MKTGTSEVAGVGKHALRFGGWGRNARYFPAWLVTLQQQLAPCGTPLLQRRPRAWRLGRRGSIETPETVVTLNKSDL